MTTTYEATGKTCINCGEEVEDYTGHWEASEVTSCEQCYETVEEDYHYRVDVVHSIPREDQS